MCVCAETGQVLAGLGERQTKFGRTRATVGRSWSRYGLRSIHSAEFDTALGCFCQHRVPKSVEVTHHMGRTPGSIKFGPMLTGLAATSANFGPKGKSSVAHPVAASVRPPCSEPRHRCRRERCVATRCWPSRASTARPRSSSGERSSSTWRWRCAPRESVAARGARASDHLRLHEARRKPARRKCTSAYPRTMGWESGRGCFVSSTRRHVGIWPLRERTDGRRRGRVEMGTASTKPLWRPL